MRRKKKGKEKGGILLEAHKTDGSLFLSFFLSLDDPERNTTTTTFFSLSTAGTTTRRFCRTTELDAVAASEKNPSAVQPEGSSRDGHQRILKPHLFTASAEVEPRVRRVP